MSESTTERGHLFVIDGDLTKIACDAWLLPTDDDFDITELWWPILTGKDTPTYEDALKLHRDIRAAHAWPVRGDSGLLDDSRRIIPYVGHTEGSDIYLARIGHSGGRKEIYADAVIEFVKLATARYEQSPDRPAGRVRLAINQIGSGRGGGKQVRGGILDHLISTIEAAINSGEIKADVVLVSWGEKAEAAAQYLRLEGKQNSYSTSNNWHFENGNLDLHAKARDLALHFKARNACVFMGAGVSGGAGLPMWDELLDSMSNGLSETDRVAFGEATNLHKASILKQSLGAETFAASIKSRLHSPKFSLMHGLLSSLPCDEFITTNVEQLFERASSSKARKITILPSLEHHHLIDRWLLKIHGCVSRPDTVVFTKEEYDRSVSSRRALFGVLQAMLLTRHIVFVGYSLSDPDFQEILREVEDALPSEPDRVDQGSRKLGTILTLFTDNTKLDDYARLFDVVPISSASSSNHSKEDFNRAVRDLERFLDLIGMLSSDRASFLLDDRYSALLNEAERDLASVLVEVARQAGSFSGASGWDQVWDVLRSLGAHPDLIGKNRPQVLSDVPHISSE